MGYDGCMVDLLTIWVRQGLADINERIRELFRRQIRKLIELVLTDTDLMARLRDAASMLGEIEPSKTVFIWNLEFTKATRSIASLGFHRT